MTTLQLEEAITQSTFRIRESDKDNLTREERMAIWMFRFAFPINGVGLTRQHIKRKTD